VPRCRVAARLESSSGRDHRQDLALSLHRNLLARLAYVEFLQTVVRRGERGQEIWVRVGEFVRVKKRREVEMNLLG
jgi:hypothetical protein